MSFKPHVGSTTKIPEFTTRAIILGVLLGLLFGVGNAYLGLKIGTTVSASIPAAVISMAVLRLFFKRVSILENNLVQTIASVGEGLAAGVIFTVPALYLLGEPPSPGRVFLLSSLGGILGVLFMIPMRRYIIVEEHGKLPFPEGTACAEILKSGEAGRSKALMAGIGILTGALHKICSSALYLFNEVPTKIITRFQNTEFSMDCTPALLGVGFIIGPRIASYILAGGALAWWVLIPLIKMFGGTDIIYPGIMPVAQMSAEDVWASYIRYIGAGAVAIGGIASLVRIFPLIFKTFKMGFKELFEGARQGKNTPRTDKDISLRYLILGSAAIILTLWLFPGLPMNFTTVLLLVILGFFFVAVTSLTVGIVGSTSNPVSGMTITTLLITCFIFVALGWTERVYLIAAITMGVVANVAIALAGTTSQDLKTGYILGATPRLQQIGEIIGIFLPALALGGTLLLLNKAYVIGSTLMPAPQGTMLALIAQGVMKGNIPTTLVVIGGIIAALLWMLKQPILPFAIGLYLPLSLSTPIMVGGLAAAAVTHFAKEPDARERGILTASGLVAGDAFTGVVIALLTVLGIVSADGKGYFNDYISLAIFAALGVSLTLYALHPLKAHRKTR
ncbi:MAG: oligopeptide transporter, OPT family [Chlamydiota bacterium]